MAKVTKKATAKRRVKKNVEHGQVNPDKHSAEIEPVWECRVLVKNSDLPDSSYLQKIYFHAETLKVM